MEFWQDNQKQNPGRLIGPPKRTTGTVPGCSLQMLREAGDGGQLSTMAIL